jgi:hypothetical protein
MPRARIPERQFVKKAMDYWERNFSELVNFVKGWVHRAITDTGTNAVTVRAGVKSGKRLLVMIFAAYTDAGPSGNTANVFLSCYKRKSDNNQRRELSNYMPVCSVNTRKSARECLTTLKSLTKIYRLVVIHYDEFDHGSGTEQLMGNGSDANLWDYIMSNTKIKVIKYSASPEEGIVADSNEVCLLMPDHPNYRGAKYFLDNNLCYNVENPVVKDISGDIIDISDQVKDLIRRAIAHADQHRQRPIVIVRIPDDFASFARIVKAGNIPELAYNESDSTAVRWEFVSSTDSATARVPWDDYDFWKREAASANRAREIKIYFIDKECMRSTDWFFHPFLFGYHDYHGLSSALNTIIQSNLRVAYFKGKKDADGKTVYPDNDFPILLYGDIEVLEYVAGRRPLDMVSRRVSSRAVVSPTDPTTFGRPFRLQMTDAQLELDCMQGNINEAKRELVKKLLLELPGLTKEQREIIENRQLIHRRRYDSDATGGGIHTVHKRYVEGRVSKPGGGCASDSEAWDNRHKYFWMDYAKEDTGGIPKGTVYITYGNPDDGDDDKSFAHTISQDRDGVPRSIFVSNDQVQEATIPTA